MDELAEARLDVLCDWYATFEDLRRVGVGLQEWLRFQAVRGTAWWKLPMQRPKVRVK